MFAGDKLGFVGNTGYSDGAHLHFCTKNAAGVEVPFRPYLPEYPMHEQYQQMLDRLN